MASTYNPYQDIKSIYDLKGQWEEANKIGDDVTKNNVAAKAQAYYDKLKNNDYSGVAKALSASGYQDAKAILDSYAPTVSNEELSNKNNVEVNTKVNNLYDTQTKDHSELTDMYKKEYNDIKNTNPFTTAEAKAILGKYDLAGLQGRDNAVASGGASNGGNIDSYAAANALRQQASLVNQGQMAVLDAHQQKIDNARSILEGLGAYQKDSYKGMQDTIGIQQTEGQRLFENDQTAKNNEVDNLVKQASVTGYTPIEWTIKNDDVYRTYLNEDGTFKKEMEGVDIQALIDSAKAMGDTETAQKLAAVRARKMLGNWTDFGQFANQGDVSSIKEQITEARRESEQNNATVLETLKEESANTKETLAAEERMNQEALAAEERINNSKNQTELNKIDKETQAQKELLEFQNELSGGTKSLSEDSIKTIDTFAKSLNNVLKSHKSNPDGIEIISNEGNGSLKLNIPEGTSKSWWRDPIMYRIMDSNALTDDEKNAIIISLGWTDKDIIEMYDTYPELDK